MESISVINHDVVTSTSDVLLVAAGCGAPEGLAVRARVQTEGRGRHGREWVSPRGNLYVSVLLRPRRGIEEWPSLSLVAGLSLYDAIALYRDEGMLGLKWPNDLLYRGKKCGGLLLEIHDDAVLLGCGVNLSSSPEGIDGWPAISLNDSSGDLPDLDCDKVMASFFDALLLRYNEWCEGGFLGMRGDWLLASSHYEKDLVVERHDGAVEGRFVGLDVSGGLCLVDKGGARHVISQGDVVRAGLSDVISD